MCHIHNEISCPEGYKCAVIYYKDSPDGHPQGMCSDRLEPGACSGRLNNGTHFIACCSDRDKCNDPNLAVPVYADPTTTTTEASGNQRSTEIATDSVAAGSDAGVLCCHVRV